MTRLRRSIGALFLTLGLSATAVVVSPTVANASPYAASYCGHPGAYALSWASYDNPSALAGHGWNIYFQGFSNPSFAVAWGWPNVYYQTFTAVAIGNRWYLANKNDPSSAYWLRVSNIPTSIVSSSNGFRQGVTVTYGGDC